MKFFEKIKKFIVLKKHFFFQWETLIANVGGNLGFFMGLTLVTFMEVFEFFWDILVTTIRKYRESKTRSSKKFQIFPKDRNEEE